MDPRPLTKGKTALAEFASFRENGTTLRQAGFQGCVLEHYCWDRAKFSALSRLVKAWRRSQQFRPSDDAPGDVLQETQFV
eukprot:1422844-Pyramimonas_sp.AAC.1